MLDPSIYCKAQRTTEMYSFPSTNERHQQAGAASQATSYYTQNTWRNTQAGNETNACWYATVSPVFQQPQGRIVSLNNGGYPRRQMSGWQSHTVSHHALSPQQKLEVKNYSHQASMTNGQIVWPNRQRENTGFPTSHGVHAHQNYGNMNQVSAAAHTANTTSVSFNQTTHGGTLASTAYSMQASQNNMFGQNDARHVADRNVYVSNLATSLHSLQQNLSASNAHQKNQQFPAEQRSAYNYGGAGSNDTNSLLYVTHKVNNLYDGSSHSSAESRQRLGTLENGSDTRGLPPPYRASGQRVLQPVRKPESSPNKQPAPNVYVFQDTSRQHSLEKLKSHISNGALSSPPKERILLKYLLTTSSSIETLEARNASPSDNKISKENPAVSSSDSSQSMAPHFSPPRNRNQSPRNLSDTRLMMERPSPVQPSDCSAHAAAPGTKVIAVVQPLPCENVQVCCERRSPDTDKTFSSAVSKIAAWLRKETAVLPEKTCGMKTAGGGSKDDSDLLAAHSPPQSSTQECQLENEKGDAQESVPSPALESTKSPKDQEEGEEKETSRPASPNAFVLRGDAVYTEQPYKSAWLNVNEQLDDIDKEFGFPWSLKCQYYKHESDDESDGETNGVMTADAESVTSNQVSSQTQLSPAQTAEDGEAQSPKSVNDDTESCYSFKLEVLPPEVAKHVYEQAASLVTLHIDDDKDTGSGESTLADEAANPKTMEEPSGSLLSKPRQRRVHAAAKRQSMKRGGSSNGEKKTPNPIQLIDLTNDQSTSIIISDEDEDFIIIEKEIPAKIPDPDVNRPEPKEICAASVQMITLESPDNPTDRESDDKAGCEQNLVKSAEANELHLDFQAPLSDISDLEDQSSSESFEIRKSKKDRQSDVDSQHALERVSKRDETVVDATAAQPSRSIQRSVQLALYGSAQKGRRVYEPPTFLSVLLSPLKRKANEDVCRANKPVKQLILEKWMESLHPTKVRKKNPPSAESPKRGKRPVSKKKTGMDQMDGLVKRRKVVKKNAKKNAKKYAVTVKEADEHGKSEPENENRDPSANPDNIVLKFTVLPDTFDFKDRSETTEETPAAKSAGCERSVKKPEPVGGKHQSHNEVVNKEKVTWNMNPSKLVLPPPIPKKSDIFHEFQKKHTKKTSAAYR